MKNVLRIKLMILLVVVMLLGFLISTHDFYGPHTHGDRHLTDAWVGSVIWLDLPIEYYIGCSVDDLLFVSCNAFYNGE